MARTTTGFRWDFDKIRPSLKSGPQKARSYLSRITTYHAMRTETYARIMARWRDRTGNARSGLTGVANNAGSGAWHYELILYSEVEYGIWLEVRWGGRYAIIRDTLRQEAPQYFKSATEVLDRMFGAGLV